MNKGCSPIRVTNPVSSNHIVSLHPKQDIVVTFDSQKEAVLMKSDSDFIRTITDSLTYFKFGQEFDFSDLIKYSKLYLGSIAFDKGTSIVNLSVVLDSLSNVKNNIIVVNPIDCQLKINTEDIIEVIICEPTVDKLLCNIIKGEKDLEYSRDFGLTINQESSSHAYYAGNPVVPFCVDTKNSTSIISSLPRYKGAAKEHHFWFKLTPESIEKSKELSVGSYNAGKIVFIVPKYGAIYQIDLILDIRKKKIKKENKSKNIVVVNTNKNNTNKNNTNKNNTNKNIKAVVVYKAEPYRPQKVSITQKAQPALDGNNCHWEWHHEFKLIKKNDTVIFRGYKDKKNWPLGAWEDTEGFIRSGRGDVIGYSEENNCDCYSRHGGYGDKGDCLGIYE